MSKNYKIVIYFKSIIILLFVSNTDNSNTIEISGIGWHSPQLIFSSRYFFVRNKSVDVLITSPDSECRVWTQVLNDTNFGENYLTIIRYKLLSDVCLGGIEIQLSDKTTNEVLARKVVVEDIYSEKCICRRTDWSLLMKCNEMTQQFNQIDSDLRFCLIF